MEFGPFRYESERAAKRSAGDEFTVKPDRCGVICIPRPEKCGRPWTPSFKHTQVVIP
jgi:hypothetical protein